MKLFRIFLLIGLISCSAGVEGQTLKSWKFDALEIRLTRIIQCGVSFGFHSVPANHYMTYEILRNNKSIVQGGSYEISQDSCILTFLELPEDRVTQKGSGTKYSIDLCSHTIKSWAITKPKWDATKIRSATITPLDSVIYNPYNPHAPFHVRNYDNGKPRELHQKNIVGLCIFFDVTNLLGPFRPSEFMPPYTPQFKITFTEGDKKIEVLTYWDKYIVDGSIYGSSGSSNTPFSLNFWESNLKLLELDER